MCRAKALSGVTPQKENTPFYLYNDVPNTTVTEALSHLGLKVTQCANPLQERCMEQTLFAQISQLVHKSIGIWIPNSKLSQNFRIDRTGEKSQRSLVSPKCFTNGETKTQRQERQHDGQYPVLADGSPPDLEGRLRKAWVPGLVYKGTD